MICEEILKAKFITITFLFSSFAFVSDLLDCTSTLMLMRMTAIMIVICRWCNSTAAAAEFNCLKSFARIMMMIAVLT